LEYNRKKSRALAGPFVRARAKARLVEAESQQVTLEVGLHPELSKTQTKFIALDYGMSGGKIQIAVRRAPLYYALRPLGPDTEPSARPPEDQKIAFLNAAKIIG
jgi:hypothetical protein